MSQLPPDIQGLIDQAWNLEDIDILADRIWDAGPITISATLYEILTRARVKETLGLCLSDFANKNRVKLGEHICTILESMRYGPISVAYLVKHIQWNMYIQGIGPKRRQRIIKVLKECGLEVNETPLEVITDDEDYWDE